MGSKHIRLGIVGVLLLLTLGGCGSGKLAKEIAEQRKSGDLTGARSRALEALGENADRLEIWRELAYCDEALYRATSRDDTERLPLLVEAGLICAVVSGTHQGQAPDEPWDAVFTLVAGHLKVCRSATLDKVKIHQVFVPVRSGSLRSGDIVEKLADPLNPSLGRVEIHYEADAAEAEAAMFRYSRLHALARRLPRALAGGDSSLAAAEEDLREWTAKANVSTAHMIDLYEAGDRAVGAAYQRALTDLEDLDYLQLATITENGILER